jgi:hypothetical protein
VRSDLALRSEGVITESADIRRVEPLTTYLSGVLVQLNPLHRSAFICSLVLKVERVQRDAARSSEQFRSTNAYSPLPEGSHAWRDLLLDVSCHSTFRLGRNVKQLSEAQRMNWEPTSH